MTTKTVEFYRTGWKCSGCNHEDNPEDDNECVKCQKPYQEEQDEYWERNDAVEFPAKWVICYDCQGEGTTYLGWASKDQPAFTQEDFAYEGGDFQEEYMEGRYDRQCPACKDGSGKVKEINEDVIKADSPLGALLKQYHDKLKTDADHEAECAAEQRMGA
jgi:hypothetical protein